MPLPLPALLLLALVLGVVAPPARAQEKAAPSDTTDETKPYVSPPAWKSVEIGDFYLRRKRYRAALSRYQEAIKTDPYYAQGYLGLGKVYDRIGLKQKALEAYRKYLDLLPSAKEAEQAKDVQNAVARLERQLKTSKRPPPTSSSPAIPASPPQ
jgi:tetratricopeptide (TPR) repeat protein